MRLELKRDRITRRTGRIAMLLVCMAAFGCTGSNVRFVNIPPLPNVLPDPQEFKVTFVVENKSNQTYQPNSLKVRLEANYHTEFQPQACIKVLNFTLGLMEPGDTFTQEGVEFGQDSTPCGCAKNFCSGIVRISLTNSNGDLKPGPRTKMKIKWEDSGDIADLIVTDES